MTTRSSWIAVWAALALLPALAEAQDGVEADGAAMAEAPDPDDRFVGYVEWISARIGGGNYGGHQSLSAFSLRWRWFYWTILNIAGGGGLPGGNDKFDVGYYGMAGTRVGIPLHLGEGGRHEIRVGAGIAGGIVQMEVYRTWWQETKTWYCTSHGPFLQVELLYQIHVFRRLAVLAGYEGTFTFNYVNDNGYPNDNWETQDVHAGFVGIAI